jgi:hypothetical protein
VSPAPYLDILGCIHKQGICAMPRSVPLAEAGQHNIPPLQGSRQKLSVTATEPCSLLP